MSKEKYILAMTDEQAGVISRACDFYARILNGQFNEICWETLVLNTVHPLPDDFCERRDKMEQLLLQARACAFPELNGAGHHYGVGHDETADIAWNVHQVIRHCRAWNNHPEGGLSLDFCKPLDISGVGMPKCEVKEEER